MVNEVCKAAIDKLSFNTRRCNWWLKAVDNLPEVIQVSIPVGAIDGNTPILHPLLIPCFNTRRCNWWSTVSADANLITEVSIPVGAIDGNKAIYADDLPFGFQYP